MKMQFSLGHMARAMTRETLRKELPDSRLLEVKIFLRNQSNCATAFAQARIVCMQNSQPSGIRDQCLTQGNKFATCHFLESHLSGLLFVALHFVGHKEEGSQKHGPYLGKV